MDFEERRRSILSGGHGPFLIYDYDLKPEGFFNGVTLAMNRGHITYEPGFYPYSGNIPPGYGLGIIPQNVSYAGGDYGYAIEAIFSPQINLYYYDKICITCTLNRNLYDGYIDYLEARYPAIRQELRSGPGYPSGNRETFVLPINHISSTDYRNIMITGVTYEQHTLPSVRIHKLWLE